MSEPNELVSVFETLIYKAREEYDKFVFSIISPFCIATMQTETEISKEKLADALLKQKPRKPARDAWRHICPVCGSTLYAGKFDGRDFENHYCAKCGQKIDFKGET